MNKSKMICNKEWADKRYKVFNKKVDYFKEHKKYGWLRKTADDCIVYNEGCGLNQIIASDFIERIEQASLDYIGEWLDGKNELKWEDIQEQNIGDNEIVQKQS